LRSPLVLVAAAPAGAATLTNPVIPGDHPDPTIVRVGEVFYSVDSFTAVATVLAPHAQRPAVGLAAHGPGRVLRGIELRDGRLRAFRADNRGLRLGIPTPKVAGTRLQLVMNVTADGAIAFYAAPPGGAFTRIAGGPAETGAPPTRMALTCRGTGTVRFGSVHVVTSGQQAPRMPPDS
jgi:hypothetical protein